MEPSSRERDGAVLWGRATSARRRLVPVPPWIRGAMPAANPWNRQAIEPRNHRTASARIAERRLRATTVSRKWPDDGVNTAMAVAPATTCRDRLTGTRLAAPPFRLELLGATFPPPPSRHRFLAAVFPTPPSQHRAHAIIFLRPTSRHHPATAPDRRKPTPARRCTVTPLATLSRPATHPRPSRSGFPQSRGYSWADEQ